MAQAAAKRAKAAAKAANTRKTPTKTAARAEPEVAPKVIDKTTEAYKVPIVLPAGLQVPDQCCTWPRYDGLRFVMGKHISGESMLDLTADELKALRVIELRTKKRQEKWPGRQGHYN